MEPYILAIVVPLCLALVMMPLAFSKTERNVTQLMHQLDEVERKLNVVMDHLGVGDERPSMLAVERPRDEQQDRGDQGVPRRHGCRPERGQGRCGRNGAGGQTLKAANPRLITYQAAIPLVDHWGGGHLACVDGLRFVVSVHRASRTP